MVVILSTMTREALRRPLRPVGETGKRISGVSVRSVVKAQTVIDAVASKRSSYTITVGRGFPA